jgi:preprotein translocase subunit SecE
MNSNQQIVLLGFIVLGVIAAMFLSSALESLWGYLDFRDFHVVGQNITFTTLLAVVVAATAVTLLLRRESTRTVSNEIVVELRRVTWPNIRPWFSAKSEVWMSTYVVIVTVIVFAFVFLAFDYVWAGLTGLIYGD